MVAFCLDFCMLFLDFRAFTLHFETINHQNKQSSSKIPQKLFEKHKYTIKLLYLPATNTANYQIQHTSITHYKFILLIQLIYVSGTYLYTLLRSLVISWNLGNSLCNGTFTHARCWCECLLCVNTQQIMIIMRFMLKLFRAGLSYAQQCCQLNEVITKNQFLFNYFFFFLLVTLNHSLHY